MSACLIFIIYSPERIHFYKQLIFKYLSLLLIFFFRPSLYGGIGVEISKVIISSLLVDKVYHENGKKINPSFQDGSNPLQFLSDCILHKNVANFNVSEKQSLISSLVGIKYAYKGLTNELSNLNIHTHQPALETFENEELFFIVNIQVSSKIEVSVIETFSILF